MAKYLNKYFLIELNFFGVSTYDALIESAFRLSKENFGDKIDSRKCASGKDRSNYLWIIQHSVITVLSFNDVA